MSAITTHVLDTARGGPAPGVPISLEARGADGEFTLLKRGVTNADGRLPGLVEPGALEAGVFRITFDTGTYFSGRGEAGFYPEVVVVFEVTRPDEHHHVPLLLSPFGYSTYRGS